MATTSKCHFEYGNAAVKLKYHLVLMSVICFGKVRHTHFPEGSVKYAFFAEELRKKYVLNESNWFQILNENLARTALVWMDDWAEFFFQYNRIPKTLTTSLVRSTQRLHMFH